MTGPEALARRAGLSILTGMSGRFGSSLVALAGCVILAACGEPPVKEMDLARQAIRAARDAHAEAYAAAELKAAEDAFEKSTAAVTGGDFKLALNHALTSHERAQAAARMAAEAETPLRTRLGTTIEDATARLTAARAAVAAAAKVRSTRRTAAKAGSALTTIDGALQKAGVLVKDGDLKAAEAALEGVSGRIAAAIAPLDRAKRPAAPAGRPGTRRR
jgi:hypothetical protein